ncbi:CoA transferase [Jiangella asiatica]|uniref:CoA transferase n=2 Tax=Jiangella asiatica TaxID=2530372 RepID=A0A4R5DCI9_9ACTN|nr:CoA transferase [Jiangella asiatica]
MGALSGVRVVDAATLGAGPFVATMMAEYGAEVIKVEQPGSGDPLRHWGPQKNGVGLMWKSMSRNKKTASLNLRLRAGQDVFKQLVAASDVLIMNTRPSTLRTWGLAYEELRDVNAGLVMLHITAFGAGGPRSDQPGFGTLGEAMSGFAHLTGEPSGPPTLPPFMLADSVAALTALSGVMMALHHRDVGGGDGQLIDVNLIEPLARLLEHTVLSYDQLGLVAQRMGNRWDVSVPRNTYRTLDGKWIAMSGSAPSIARRVFLAIDREDLLSQPAYADAQGRLANAVEIDRLVAEWISAKTLDDAMKTFTDHGVAAAPVYDVVELLEDEHLVQRKAFVPIKDPDLGQVTVQAPVMRLSRTPGAVEHLGREVGADNVAVYQGILGFTNERMMALSEEGVI